jgi:hypothetical protein
MKQCPKPDKCVMRMRAMAAGYSLIAQSARADAGTPSAVYLFSRSPLQVVFARCRKSYIGRFYFYGRASSQHAL